MRLPTFKAGSRREKLRLRLQARSAIRTAVIVGVAVIGGAVAAAFARLCDEAMAIHARALAIAPWATLALLPLGLTLGAWLTRRFAPEAAGSGIPQVVAAAEQRWRGRWGGQRVTLKTGLWKIGLTALMLVCGASIGREGPTVQVVAGVMRSLTRGLRGGAGRRAMIVAGGAAGVSAAFNTPIAGVVFALEELARSFEKRTLTAIILVVVVAGFTAYALQGDYAYFGEQMHGGALGSAWFAAPCIGLVGGLCGGVFSRALTGMIGPGGNPVQRFRRARPVLFALLCGLVAAVAAIASGGITYGAGYVEAKSLLQDHPGRGLSLAFWKPSPAWPPRPLARPAGCSRRPWRQGPGSGRLSREPASGSAGATLWCSGWRAISRAWCKRP